MVNDLVALDCGHLPSPHDKFTTGYGESDGKKYCWVCCAKDEREAMQKTGRAELYLSFNKTDYHGKVTNWTGYLSWPCKVKVGKHNIAGVRYDVWFEAEGGVWHGVTYGNSTQVCHCKRLKQEGATA